jgi:hypothetical protein
MNFNELDTFRLDDAVHFHDELNQAIFNGTDMKPEVRKRLLVIAEDFVEHLGIKDLDISDITISGSNAAYSYTKHSDIDLHIVIDMNKINNDEVYRELFDAKKMLFNGNHDIKINGYEVELYVQDSNQPVISLGEYSVMNDKWIHLPRKRRANFDQSASSQKYLKLYTLAGNALKTNSLHSIHQCIKTIKKYRQAGLDKSGEFGPENLAYKALRSKGILDALYEKMDELHSKQLSMPEKVSKLDSSIENELSESWNSFVSECSGYIPSEKEKNDPRWERALSVDVRPDAIKKNAKAFGFKVSRAGIPPLLRK